MLSTRSKDFSPEPCSSVNFRFGFQDSALALTRRIHSKTVSGRSAATRSQRQYIVFKALRVVAIPFGAGEAVLDRLAINVVGLTDEWGRQTRLLIGVRSFSHLSAHAKQLVGQLKAT
jgi:hypothetical protein